MTRRTAIATKRAGLTPRMFKGVTKSKLEQKSGKGLRVAFTKEQPTQTLQFITPPSEWPETEQHVFQEDGRWQFVPCAGEGCPLCDAEDQDISRPSYLALAPVYSHSAKRVQLLELNKTMAGLVYHKYQRLVDAKKASLFTKRVYDVTVFPTKPRTYDVELAEDAAGVNVSGLVEKIPDFEAYLIDNMKRYYGDDLPDTSGVLEDEDEMEEDDDLDDEEIEDEEDDIEDEDDEDFDEDEVDEDDDDLDLDDDEDDDDLDDEDEDIDEEELTPRAARASAKRMAATKAPAKRTPVAKRAPAKKVTAAKKAPARARR